MNENDMKKHIRYFARGAQGEKLLPLRYFFEDFDDDEIEWIETADFDEALALCEEQYKKAHEQ